METIRYNSDGSNPWVADVNLYGGIGKGLAIGADLSLYAVGMYYYSVLKYSQSIPTGVEQISKIPETIVLNQNYPNPFNPSAKIRFSVPFESQVTLDIFNITGQKVVRLINGKLSAGYHEINFNASDLSGGVYFYQLKAGEFTETKKMMLVK